MYMIAILLGHLQVAFIGRGREVVFEVVLVKSVSLDTFHHIDGFYFEYSYLIMSAIGS